jgi:hypothetical protein
MNVSHIPQEVPETTRNSLLNIERLKDTYIKVLSVKQLTVHQHIRTHQCMIQSQYKCTHISHYTVASNKRMNNVYFILI